MRLRLSLCLVGWFGVCASGQTSFYPGSGSVFTAQFSQAWERDGFNLEVGNPSGNVTNLGSTGLIQLFPSVNTAGATLALVKPDTTQNFNVMQLQAAMYAYYSTLSVTIVGYPTTDTQACPLLHSTGNSADSCQWQPFNNDYALFVYTQPVQSGGQNFGIGDPFYTKWATLGGVSILGPATSGQTQVTSQYGSQATVQTYDQGAIFNITSGLLSGRLIVVAEPVYYLYRTTGGPAGSLGLPATAALLLSNGMFEQTFEGGAIEYNPDINGHRRAGATHRIGHAGTVWLDSIERGRHAHGDSHRIWERRIRAHQSHCRLEYVQRPSRANTSQRPDGHAHGRRRWIGHGYGERRGKDQPGAEHFSHSDLLPDWRGRAHDGYKTGVSKCGDPK